MHACRNSSPLPGPSAFSNGRTLSMQSPKWYNTIWIVHMFTGGRRGLQHACFGVSRLRLITGSFFHSQLCHVRRLWLSRRSLSKGVLSQQEGLDSRARLSNLHGLPDQQVHRSRRCAHVSSFEYLGIHDDLTICAASRQHWNVGYYLEVVSRFKATHGVSFQIVTFCELLRMDVLLNDHCMLGLWLSPLCLGDTSPEICLQWWHPSHPTSFHF